MKGQLILEKLNLKLKLGYSAEERSLPQWVSVKIKLCFPHLPAACSNDNLNSTLCYASLSEALQKFCDEHAFKLIEAFAYQLYQFIKKKTFEIMHEKVNIFLCITKNPQLPQLEQASFSICD
ncbi:MAG: dihydroneopterin aldolase [Pseudomonadota bacterium]|jgi:dihydroneopterin aldolase